MSQTAAPEQSLEQSSEAFAENTENNNAKGATGANTLSSGVKRNILISTLLAVFIVALDQAMVTTIMPVIIQDLRGTELYIWGIVSCFMGAALAMLTLNRLSEIYSKKLIFIVGLVLFLLASVSCGLSGAPLWKEVPASWLGLGSLDSMTHFIVFRGIQGVGLAALLVAGLGMPLDVLAGDERLKHQRFLVWAFGVGSVCGSLLGGYLAEVFSWRWAFYVGVPFGVVALVFALFISHMPRQALLSRSSSQTSPRIRVNWWGALWGSSALLLLVSALIWGTTLTHHWTDSSVLMLLGGSLLSAIFCVYTEWRHPSPLFPLSLWARPAFVLSAVPRVLIGATFIGTLFFLSWYLLWVHHASPLQWGIAAAPLTLGFVLSAFGRKGLVERTGRHKLLMVLGALALLFGFWRLSELTASTSYWEVVAYMACLGLGFGQTLTLYEKSLSFESKSADQIASGLGASAGQYFQYVGVAIGVAALGAIFLTNLSQQLPIQLAAQATQHRGLIAERLLLASEKVQQADRIVIYATKTRHGGPQHTALLRHARLTDQQVKSGFARLRRLAEEGIMADGRGRALRIVSRHHWVPKKIRNRLLVLEPTLRSGYIRETRRKAVLNTTLMSLKNAEKQMFATKKANTIAISASMAKVYQYCLVLSGLSLLFILLAPNVRPEKLRKAKLKERATLTHDSDTQRIRENAQGGALKQEKEATQKKKHSKKPKIQTQKQATRETSWTLGLGKGLESKQRTKSTKSKSTQANKQINKQTQESQRRQYETETLEVLETLETSEDTDTTRESSKPES